MPAFHGLWHAPSRCMHHGAYSMWQYASIISLNAGRIAFLKHVAVCMFFGWGSTVHQGRSHNDFGSGHPVSGQWHTTVPSVLEDWMGSRVLVLVALLPPGITALITELKIISLLATSMCWKLGGAHKVGNRVSHRTNHLLGGSHVDGLPARRRNPRRGIRLHNVPSTGRRNGVIPW